MIVSLVLAYNTARQSIFCADSTGFNSLTWNNQIMLIANANGWIYSLHSYSHSIFNLLNLITKMSSIEQVDEELYIVFSSLDNLATRVTSIEKVHTSYQIQH